MTDIVFEKNNMPMTNSLLVAEAFGKKHEYVTRKILITRWKISHAKSGGSKLSHQIIDKKSGSKKVCSLQSVDKEQVIMSKKVCSLKISDYFIKVYFSDSRKRKQKMYLITEKGYVRLSMKFTGEKADIVNDAITDQFFDMRDYIKEQDFKELEDKIIRDQIRAEHKNYTKAIDENYKALYNVKPTENTFRSYRTILQMHILGKRFTKQYKKDNGIPENMKFRDYINTEQKKIDDDFQTKVKALQDCRFEKEVIKKKLKEKFPPKELKKLN